METVVEVLCLDMGAFKAMLLSFLLLSLAICHGRARKCERITIHMCQDIGYNLTVMPNLMGHEDQLQADRGVILFRYQTDLSDFMLYVYVCENGCNTVMTPKELINRRNEHSSNSLSFVGYCLFEVRWCLGWEAATGVLFVGWKLSLQITVFL